MKQLAVNDVLINKLSKSEVVRKYGISSRSVLTNWINNFIHGFKNMKRMDLMLFKIDVEKKQIKKIHNYQS